MHCSICGSSEGLFEETRPSGAEGWAETWHFCPECWRELQEQRSDHDPVVARQYLVFLQFLSGRYRMQRAFNGNQASAIRRCGILLREIEKAHGANQNIRDGNDPKVTRKQAAQDAGLSR